LTRFPALAVRANTAYDAKGSLAIQVTTTSKGVVDQTEQLPTDRLGHQPFSGSLRFRFECAKDLDKEVIAPDCLQHIEFGAESGNGPWAEINEPIALQLSTPDAQAACQEIIRPLAGAHELSAAEAGLHQQVKGRQVQSSLSPGVHVLAVANVNELSKWVVT
jgi:hypothetical protein